MKKKEKPVIRLITAIGLAACLLASLCGCADSSVDYRVDDTETESSMEVNSSSLEQFADAGNWKEALRVTKENGDTVEINIDADITVPDVKQMSVVEVKEVEFDSSYRENLAKAFFGEGEVYYYDDEHLPKEVWEERIKKEEAETAEMRDNENVSRDSLEESENILADLEESLSNAPKDYVPVTDYDVDEYLGYRDGIPYCLSIVPLKNWTREWDIRFIPEDISLLTPEKLKGDDGINFWESDGKEDMGQSNQCKMDEDAAGNLAENYLKQSGFSDVVCADVKPLCWGKSVKGEHELQLVDGYMFHYEIGTDGCSFLAYGYEGDYRNLLAEDIDKSLKAGVYSMNSKADIYVGDDGIICVQIGNPVTVTKETENVKLLPFETIQGIIRKELEENAGQFQFMQEGTGSSMSFNSMELIYFRLTDREKKGYYTYVPTWRLVRKDKRPEDSGQINMMQNPVLVNAMDGSVIYFLDEMAAY